MGITPDMVKDWLLGLSARGTYTNTQKARNQMREVMSSPHKSQNRQYWHENPDYFFPGGLNRYPSQLEPSFSPRLPTGNERHDTAGAPVGMAGQGGLTLYPENARRQLKMFGGRARESSEMEKTLIHERGHLDLDSRRQQDLLTLMEEYYSDPRNYEEFMNNSANDYSPDDREFFNRYYANSNRRQKVDELRQRGLETYADNGSLPSEDAMLFYLLASQGLAHDEVNNYDRTGEMADEDPELMLEGIMSILKDQKPNYQVRESWQKPIKRR